MNAEEIEIAEEAVKAMNLFGPFDVALTHEEAEALVQAARFGIMVAKNRAKPLVATGKKIELNPESNRYWL